VTEPSHAVFLSYASEDQAAAQRICDALRAGGIEVWFDQSALRGGDVWDQTIRKQIKTCVLFIPVISRHTHDRDEGYFRLEWKLAVDRSHLMTSNKAFLLPVVIDETREDDENVPDRFKDIHWTRLPAGETPAAFVERVRRLVSPEPSHGPTTTALPVAPGSAATPLTRGRVATPWRLKQALPISFAVVVAGALAYFGIDKFWFSKYHASPPSSPVAPATAASPAFTPPPHSIAVLPFVNLSGDKEQEYFSDGLTEELLNSLAAVDGLQVAGRTSSFYFKGERADLTTVAHKLNVGAVLEGSVRRSGHTVRITAQLTNAVTGFHLWSKTYDRDLGDVLKLQTEVATAVASALKITLVEDIATKIELGGTRNPPAFDAYLHAGKTYSTFADEKAIRAAIDEYTEAINFDPNYALAFADRSLALTIYATDFATGQAIRDDFDKARADARRALALVPELPRGRLALARNLELGSLDFTQANTEYRRALALAPGDARALQVYGMFAVMMGRTDEGVAAARRAVVLDPLNSLNHADLGWALYYARRYSDSLAAYKSALVLDPSSYMTGLNLSTVYYTLGDLEHARALCEVRPRDPYSQPCLACVYEKLGRHGDAEEALAKLKASIGDAGAYDYAETYAQWGNRSKALEWLETALRLRDPQLGQLKTDPLLDPLRNEPRFQAIERELKFPD
jgi:TolB-like protein/Tfp pilus assembly protein PilF